ncbi:hypothetical protein [Paludifilum halophilum]|nr:hypothetical protein [Paludifilum halophilum]
MKELEQLEELREWEEKVKKEPALSRVIKSLFKQVWRKEKKDATQA